MNKDMELHNFKKHIDLSVIIPVYNDADALAHFLPKLIQWLQANIHVSEIILVDDGSTDHIESIYEKFLSERDKNMDLTLLRFSRNFGKETALFAGLEASVGDLTVMMDADGQHTVDVLEKMLKIADDEIDMVAAVQQSRADESWLSRLFKKCFYALMQDGQGYKVKPNAGDFRLMNRKVVDALLSLPERQRFTKGLYSWVGFNTVYLSYVAEKRAAGKSKFNFKELFELAVVGLTSFSQKPLRWIVRMGLVVSLMALAYGCYVVFEAVFLGKETPGWATLAAGLMFSTGVQLISIGVIGEYVGRIYEETKQRPLYIMRKTLTTRTTTDEQNNEE